MWSIIQSILSGIASWLSYRKSNQDQKAGAAENATAQLTATVETQQAELAAGTDAAAGELDASLHDGSF